MFLLETLALKLFQGGRRDGFIKSQAAEGEKFKPHLSRISKLS